MGRGPSTFRQRDVTSAIKGVAAAGFQVCRVEVDRQGKIIVHTDRQGATAPDDPERNEWDEVGYAEPGGAAGPA